ncbi:hypothetical protein LUZ61_004360 [Rhynchospora tenuis]|uniref:Nucleoporin autopeptidase n=1 Tax=Rhynchospora tenuis TaxID=198213 RepID=A0AAD5ZMI6_9POAL|nr:hypothetical protein LUZ61_004360 [Rhynchospora tenuis]
MFGSTNPFGQSSSSPFGQSSSSPFGQSSSSPFGQSSTSLFGSPSPFGQTQPPNQNNPFAPKPFGSPTTSPFGAQSGSSVFGGTSTGVFGQSSTPLFGSSSTPAFGASSTPAFGAASSSFAGSSLFGQKPAFGGFGSSPTQSTTPFGSTFQQTQPAFGSNVFGSTPTFGASSTPAFGASSTPAFGASSTPAFGASSTPAFGAASTPAFGSTSTSLFGNTTGAFGTSSTPAFGASTTPLFGASTTSAFGASSTPSFGASSSPAFGAPSTPAFGAASTSSFSFGSTPALGQTASTFGTSAPAFGSQNSPFGAQATTTTFGSPSFGQQPGFGASGAGSRLTPYTATPEEGTSGTGQTAKLESISAMPAYKDKSHEELRWEDYQRGDKGGPNPNPTGAFGQTTPGQPTSFVTGTFGQTSSANPFQSANTANPFQSANTANPFGGSKPSTPSFGSSGIGPTSSPIFGSSSSPFSSTTSFGANSTTPSIFGTTSTATTSPFSSTSIFGSNNAPAFGSSTFGSSAPAGSTFGAPFGGTQSSGLVQSSASFNTSIPSFGQPSTASGFQQSAPAFAINTSSTGFGFSTPTTGGLFNSTANSVFSQTTPILSTPFQTAASAPSLGGFSFSNFGQNQSAASGSTFSQIGQLGGTQGSVPVQPVPVTNPFGALPAMPTMSIGRVGSTPSVQYGISSMPVPEKASASITRTSTMLVPRHLSQRRIKLPPRRYSSKNDGPKVPYFADDDEVPSTPKADAFLIPRENPRSLILRPIEQWPTHTSPDIEALSKDGPTDNANGIGAEEELSSPGHIDPLPEYANGTGTEKMGKGWAGTRMENSEIAAQNGGTVSKKTVANGGSSARLPKLTQGGYYTIPSISELEKRERTEPGYCRRVKDFVVGREGYGSIMFYGETDVSGLDLESIIEFGNREVVVYRDESRKPPVGQGLNKPAEVTLLNVKWVNKKTGQQYLEPERVHKYTEMLKAKTVQQGAHFISYNAPQGEWKFKVDHF